MKIQASIEFLLISGAIAVLCLSAITLYGRQLFAQTGAFANVANALQANLSAPNGTIGYGSARLSLSASISQRSERFVYGIAQQAYVANILEKRHCTYFGFFGHPYDVQGQCGTYNAWDYLADWNCATSSAFCMYAVSTGYALASASGPRSYLYGFALTLQTPLGPASAYVSSNETSSALVLGNKTIGRVSVANVTSSEPATSEELMGNGTAYEQVNETAYQQYLQAQDALYPLLSYYNSTSIDPPTQSSIQAGIFSFITRSYRLRNSRPAASSCTAAGLQYVCNATYPFLYVMNVSVDAGLGVGNQVLYYLGSVIRVSS